MKNNINLYEQFAVENLTELHNWCKNFDNKNNELKYLEEIVDYNLKNNQQTVSNTILEAELVVDNKFHFIDPWDMERCEQLISFTEINWEHKYNGDPEWMYMICRMSFLKKLARAYAYTKNPKFANKIIALVKYFSTKYSDYNGNENTTWRTIDAGTRFSNLIYAFLIIKNCEIISENDIEMFFKVFLKHIEFLTVKYESWKRLSNWGILQSLPLLQFSLIFKEIFLESNNLFELAMERLTQSLKIQILADGGHWEKSPLYHNEVLDTFSKVVNLCLINSIEIEDWILKKIILAHEYNLKILKPDRTQPMQGDSDNTNLTSRLQVAALLFQRQDFKFFTGETVYEENVWDYGFMLTKNYQNLKSKVPAFKSFCFPVLGEGYYRSSWEQDADWLWFSCGSLGSGHGHGNSLHFSLTINGKDFLIDPGRYTYKGTDKNREYLKSQAAHNTIIVDDTPTQKFKGSWEITKTPRYICANMQEYNNEYTFFEGTDLGRVDNGQVINRQILIVDNFATIIVDDLFNYANITNVKNNFILDKNVNVKEFENYFEMTNNGTSIYFYNLNQVKPKILRAVVSYNYNSIEDSKKLFVKFQIQKLEW
ncbi:hypothetical protein SCLARK_001261 [Spiroplasma clarkii]|uniref:heparinase II/III family protein n=1 Tax=Spiroplasma clarkii TaxID=2139 RepID=UPI000B5587ED|nr:heparinase II/III family protein [Spiroplasma clarkii]ARU91803.1 hypothetical protein SCLARK_001261 [Spiroplasma clarkii]